MLRTKRHPRLAGPASTESQLQLQIWSTNGGLDESAHTHGLNLVSMLLNLVRREHPCPRHYAQTDCSPAKSRPDACGCGSRIAALLVGREPTRSHTTVMKKASRSPSGSGPTPEALRSYLSEQSQQELDTLRGELDMRLAALENALTSPDETESLESLVVELARVAMDEAEASTRRAIVAAQVNAQTQTEAARAEARTSIEAARAEAKSAIEAARAEARTSVEAARTAGATLQRIRNRTRHGTTLQQHLDEARAAPRPNARPVSGFSAN